jgi:tRNA/tmRNA/rRNA uracil-C5-methylase (TrmA/RlmC/RlmD family)
MSFEQSLLSFLQVLAMIQEFGEKNVHQLPPYDVRTHEGFLKHLIIRSGRDCNTGELQLMVNFVTKDDKPELLQPLVDHISASFPQLVCSMDHRWQINTCQRHCFCFFSVLSNFGAISFPLFAFVLT